MHRPELLLLALAAALVTHPAWAGPGDRGSLLAFPLLSSDDLSTAISISSTAAVDYRVKLLFISGEPGDDWDAVDFNCPIDASASIRLSFGPFGSDFSQVDIECSGLTQSVVIAWRSGLLWAALENATSFETVSDDVLTGSAVVSDAAVGTTAALEAVAFRKGSGSNDGDRSYELDGVEYETPPSTLAASVRGASSGLTSRAIFAVVDGRVNFSAAVPAEARITWVDAAGVAYNAIYGFDCFANVALSDIDPRFDAGVMGAYADVRFPPAVVLAPPPDDTKRTAFIGWILEEIAAGTALVAGGPTTAGASANGRAMRWANEPWVPPAGDPFPTLVGNP